MAIWAAWSELALTLVLRHQVRPAPRSARRRGGGHAPSRRPRPARAGRAGASGRRAGSACRCRAAGRRAVRRRAGPARRCRRRSPRRDRQLLAPFQAHVVERLHRVQQLERSRPASPCCTRSSARSNRRSDSGRAASTILVSSAIASSFSSLHHRIELRAPAAGKSLRRGSWPRRPAGGNG